ncbi:MAG: hypothetical protein Q9P01_19295 [Anaerolineae bacterium]|nr:hypothetical protein [Anaerolineae bacterium]
MIYWHGKKTSPIIFFTSDTNLHYVLQRYLGDDYETAKQDLAKLGASVATVIDEAAKVEDRIGNHPRLDRWSALGERIEQIEFHPNHDYIGRMVWESGIMAMQGEVGNSVKQMGLYYLLTHNGEGGHLCSLACTSGLIRALQQVASDDVREKFLPPLLNPHYDEMQHGAQFLTEVQGGSMSARMR